MTTTTTTTTTTNCTWYRQIFKTCEHYYSNIFTMELHTHGSLIFTGQETFEELSHRESFPEQAGVGEVR